MENSDNREDAQIELTPGTNPKWVGTEVEGNNYTDRDRILDWFGHADGQELDEAGLKAGAQSVFDSGYFTDVRLDYKIAEGGVIVKLRVLENPIGEQPQKGARVSRYLAHK
jgi:outer membrane protein assembly factor BamA